MRSVIAFVCLLSLASPSMADTFTYEIERAGYDFGQSDKKGEITYSGFIKEFRAFPWIEEIERWLSLKKGTSPTLSVVNSKHSKVYWVSMAGDKSDHAYLLGIEYEKQAKSFFGLGKPKTIPWLEIFVTQDQRVVEDTFGLFFRNEHEKLMARLRTLEQYDEMESKR
jgi:hypothetical protein